MSEKTVKNFRSIKTKLLFAVMGASTFLTSMVIFLNFYFEYNKDLNALEERVAQVQKTTVPTLSNAIWNLDEQYLKIQLEGILKIEDIVLTRIIDGHGELILEKGQSLKSKNEIIKREFYLYNDLDDTREYLGKLQLFITRDYIVEKIKKKVLLFMTSQFVKTFLLAWIFLLIFHYYIIKYVERIINFSKTFDLDSSILNRLDLNKKPDEFEYDEIDILQLEINKMLEKIYMLNQQKDQKISEQQKEIQIQKALEINSARLTSIQEMLSGMAHEINNPMTVISFSAKKISEEIEKDEKDLEKIMSFSKKITDSSTRVKNILHSIQATSRPTDDDPFEISTLEDLINGVQEALIAETSMYDIQLSLKFNQSSTKDLLLKVKRVALFQILQILVKNAVDAVKHLLNGSIILELESNGDCLYFKVKDSGLGISPNQREKIFDPFYTTKEIGKSTGLGLTIASRLALINEGELYLDNNEKMTTFVLKLPLYK